MLQLFGSGLVSFWLNTVGLHAKPIDALDLLVLPSSPRLILASEPGSAGATIQQYLQELAALDLKMANQGVWIQSGPILLANHQGTVPLPAASLTKIATSLAALRTWKPNHQFETLIGATGPINNGVLRGDLIVLGSGDPLFVWEEAIALGHSLNQIGIKQVTGNLIVTGNFVMNYNTNPTQAGELLKQGLDSQLWSNAAVAEYMRMSPGTPRPQVAISGSVQVAFPIPKQILLVRHRSLPLAQLIKEMNVYSNNEMAQTLADTLGGATVVQQQAALATGVPQPEIQLANGSGLGVENRISPRAACAMFMAIQRELLPHQLSVADLFPTSGRDQRGTLEARRIPVATVIKTGTLRDVSALAGVMPTRDRGLVWFTIINRGWDVPRFRSQQDQLLQRLLQRWQVAPALPAALLPRSASGNPPVLGATDRNEILYKG